MAGAIYFGHLKKDQTNWILLPGNEAQTIKAGDYVFSNKNGAFSLLMSCVYHNAANKSIFPFYGGLLDQPRSFYEAMKLFDLGNSLYREKIEYTASVLKMLGAKK